MKILQLRNEEFKSRKQFYACSLFVNSAFAKLKLAAQKMKFYVKGFFSKCDQFTEKILVGKLHFLCSVLFLIAVHVIATLLLNNIIPLPNFMSAFITAFYYYISTDKPWI